MHKYYFKIRKNDTELEFSTDDLMDFDTKVSEWVEEICSTCDEVSNEILDKDEKILPKNSLKRKGFIDLKKLVKVRSIAPQENIEPPKFEEVLEDSITKPKLDLDSVTKNENELYNLIEEKKPDSSLKLLIMTAFYMLHLENMERFTIKQLNSRLVPLNQSPITHSDIDEAIMEDLIEIIPDLTGLGDVTEYNLTQKGEEYYYNEL